MTARTAKTSNHAVLAVLAVIYVLLSLSSRQNALNHLTSHIRQPEMPALELERQPFMVDAEAVQDRRLKVEDVHWV